MSKTDHEIRRDVLTSRLTESKLDALLVSSLANVRYLTGFTGSNGVLLMAGGAAILFTDSRYGIQAEQETTCKVKLARGSLLEAVVAVISRKRCKKVGFEKFRTQYAAYEFLQSQLPSPCRLHPADGLVEEMRMVKSAAEIDLIRRSVQINSSGFERVIRKIRPGMRESELAAELDYRTRRCKAQRMAFETIVASGPRSALPHAQPSDNPISGNQLLLVDMGAVYEGYSSDMTRMAFIGKPDKQTRDLYSAVLEAQLAGVAAVGDGVEAGAVDRRTRQVLRRHGLADRFVHSTGHGLGLEIHESPRLGRGEKTRLRAGMVVTIEPGVYLEGFGGIRIEDTVLVTSNGCEVLTPTSKELLIV